MRQQEEGEGKEEKKRGRGEIIFYCATSVASRVNFTPDGTAAKFRREEKKKKNQPATNRMTQHFRDIHFTRQSKPNPVARLIDNRMDMD